MNTPPSNHEEEIFQTALALPAAERAAYLDAVCGDDHELRKRVGRLLALHEASGFMEGLPETLRSEIEEQFARLKPEEAGERIGNYKLLEQIGEGGFGTVWVADQEQPVRRQVALKILKLGMDTREVIARFEQERQALAVMDHPNIAKVFDAGATQFGRPYFVMELVHGSRITDYCDEAKLSTRERLRLFIAVCQAVQHAHQKGIIHRDIKPSNILVTVQDGVPVPKVIDFGVAKAIRGRLTEATITTNLEQMIGTPLYMSPEQAEASGGDVDTRSDIYSLGVLLYELLTGRTPFTREDLMKAGYNEMRRLICESEPRKPSAALQTMAQNLRTTVATCRHTDAGTLTSMVRGDLDWIVMKALEKDRNRRYETASGFAEDVRRHLANEPVTAAAPGAIYRIRKFARRNKLIFAAGTIVLLSLLTGIAVSNWALLASRAAERDAKEQESKAKAQVREASRSDLATAQQRLSEGKWQEGVAYLGRAIRYDAGNRNAQDALWLALRYGQRDVGRLPVYVLEPEGVVDSIFSVTSAAFSPDGTRIVTTSAGKVRLWDAKSGQPIDSPLKHDGYVHSAAFSPDGTRIVTTSAGKVRVWDLKTGQQIGATLKHDGSVESAAFSPDGTRIVTVGDTARLWDAKSGQPIGASLKHEDCKDCVVREASFSPDGTLVVTTAEGWGGIRRGFDARLWDATTGQPIGFPFKHEDGRVSGLSFSPDGTRIVTVGDPARLWDAKTGQPIGSPLKHEDCVVSKASFSPDGTRIVTTAEGWDKTGRVWDARVWDAKTGQALGSPIKFKHDFPGSSAAFSPDGTRIVTVCYSNVRVWDAKTGQPIGPPLKHDGYVLSAAFSPDGTRVLTVIRGGNPRVWESSSGQPIGSPVNHQDGYVKSARFSPDGTRILTVGNTARVLDATTGQPIGPPLKHRDHEVISAAFSPDGTRIVTVPFDKTVQVWDAKTSQAIGTPLTHDNWVLSAAFSPDGTRIFTTSKEGKARVWDAGTGQPIGSPVKFGYDVDSAAFSPDGTRVVTTREGPEGVGVWDAGTGQPIGVTLQPFDYGSVRSAAFSPDGTRIVTVCHDKVRMLDANTGQPIGVTLQPYEPGPQVRAVFFSPDGTRIVTVGMTAQLWDAKTGQPIGPPFKHDSYVTSAAFSPDGTRIVTTSGDHTAQVWDAKTGQPIGSHLKHWQNVGSPAFSPDGTRILTVSGGAARVWDAKAGFALTAEVSEWLTAYCSGAKLNPEMGSLQQLTVAELMALRKKLTPFLSSSEDWAFVARQTLSQNPEAALVSPHMTMTLREATTRLIGTMESENIREAASIAPSHPILPFAHAVIEAQKRYEVEPANPARAAWLVDYGMKHLPADTNAADLTLAAKLVAKVAESIPEQRATALLLLDRARDKEPETDETKALREKLNK